MVNETKDYILSLLEKGIRKDGRKLDEYRKDIKIEYGISSKSAEGSARVMIGKTEVVAGVKLEVDKPYPDNPDEGTIIVNAELIPLASPDFESGPPAIESIELSRVVDRGIRESQALDFKKLCIKEGEKVWIVFIDIYPMNDAGNLYDAANLAALAALKDAKFPKYDEEKDKIVYEKTNKSLPLTKFPIACTLVKINKYTLIDPSIEEEKAMDARLTVTITEDNTICALQKGGDSIISIDDIDKMIDLTIEKAKDLRKLI